MSISIIGDFGGTNARLGVSTPHGITAIKEYKCADYPDPSAIIKNYIENEKMATDCEQGLFAVAGASSDPKNVIFTNGPWRQKNVDFTNTPIKASTRTMNDFDAICYSIAELKAEDTEIITQGHDPFYPSTFLIDDKTYTDNSTRLLVSPPSQRFVTIGPGTGLGVSTGLLTKGGQFLVLGGEGGHADFAPSTPEELELKKYLESIDIIVTAETIASGTGLATTFNAICEIRDLNTKISSAAELSAQLDSSKPKAIREAARWTLRLFAETLGQCAASAALTNNARTVFIAGGVIPKLGSHFYKNAFARSFRDNDLGQNNSLKETPVALITHSHPGLLGAHSLLNLEKH